MPEASSRLAPFVCASCGSPIAAVDAPSARCPACGADQPVPAAHREAVRLLRGADDALQRATATLARYQSRTVPWGVVVAVSWLPALIVAGGIAGGAALEFALKTDIDVPVFLAEVVWGPVIIAAGLATLVFWYSSFLSGWLPEAKAALAAKPPANDGSPPECRLCGAPLVVHPGDTFARCIYCGADSLVVLDAIEARRLARTVDQTEAEAGVALARLRERGQKASFSSLWMLVIWVGLALLPLLWSLGGKGFRTSGWAVATSVVATPLILYSMMMSFGAASFGDPARARAPGSASAPSGRFQGVALLAVLIVLVLFYAIAYAEAP